MHRIRSALVQQRTAKVNQICGLLVEYGIAVERWGEKLRKALPLLPEDADNGLSPDFRALLQGQGEDLSALDDRVGEMDKKIQQLASGNEAAKRLQQIPGIDPVITATALVCAIGGDKQFKLGRDLAARLGLTPQAAQQWRQGLPARHQQMGRRLPEDSADTRREGRARGRPGQQERSHRLRPC